LKKELSKAGFLNQIPLVLFALVFLVFVSWAQQDQTPAPAPAPASTQAPVPSPPAPTPAPAPTSAPTPAAAPVPTAAAAPAPAPESKPAPEEAAKANPVKRTEESLAKGKKLYGFDCAMCHGDNGNGKGDMATDMKNVTDFTNPDAMKNRTDGELYNVIRKGKGEMPAEGNRGKDEDIWNLVNYIRSLAKK
jgi:mono/diheme cytochrome c family protein